MYAYTLIILKCKLQGIQAREIRPQEFELCNLN